MDQSLSTTPVAMHSGQGAVCPSTVISPLPKQDGQGSVSDSGVNALSSNNYVSNTISLISMCIALSAAIISQVLSHTGVSVLYPPLFQASASSG